MPRLLTSKLCPMGAERSLSADCLHDDSGQSMLELALVLPVLFVLMIGFINFCMILFGLSNISYACRQADRYACLHSKTSQLPVSQSTIDAQVTPYILKYPASTYSDLLSYGPNGNVVGETATVAVKITYNIVLPFIRVPVITLSSTASGTIIQ